MNTIRESTPADLDAMMEIYAYARNFMKQTGNPTQWGENHPARELLEEDIALWRGYVVVDESDQPHAAFMFAVGEDPTYRVIEGGAWLNDRPYGVIHRLASDGSIRGIFSMVADFCGQFTDTIRVDTHADNHVMQHLFEKNGFTRCGTIYLANGAPRIAYLRTRG